MSEMNYNIQDDTELSLLDNNSVFPLSIILVWPVIIGVMSVAALDGFNYLVIGFGVLSAAAFLLRAMTNGLEFPSALVVFGLFILWAACGIFVIEYMVLYVDRMKTLVQLWVLALIIASYCQNIKCTTFLLVGVLIGVVIVAVSAVYTGDYNRAQVDGADARLGGITLNANTFAITITYGLIILLYLFKTIKSWLLKGVILGSVLLAYRFVVASGSRKGFVIFVLIIVSWFIFSYGLQVLKKPIVAFGMAVMIFGFGIYAYSQLQDTVLFERLIKIQEQVHSTSASDGGLGVRRQMFDQAIELTMDNPIFGVGLDHFQIASGLGTYSHNNYVEIMSTTGVLGIMIYIIIYIIMGYNLWHLGRCDLPFKYREMINIGKVYMVVRLCYDMGVVSYYEKKEWVLLAIFIGFTHSVTQKVRTQNLKQDEGYTYEDDSECGYDENNDGSYSGYQH